MTGMSKYRKHIRPIIKTSSWRCFVLQYLLLIEEMKNKLIRSKRAKYIENGFQHWQYEIA
jgi:hypothetical protein